MGDGIPGAELGDVCLVIWPGGDGVDSVMTADLDVGLAWEAEFRSD